MLELNGTPDFDKGNGLVVAIIQDHSTSKVLMTGFMNKEALDITLRDGKVTFWSRTKGRLWTKGETSGNYLFAKQVTLDCDNDALLFKVRPVGPVCHTGADTCFREKNVADDELAILEQTIRDRIAGADENSYTSRLVRSGINKVAQKVGEEAVELVIEAKDDDKEKFLNEGADLVFHLLVLLQAKECSLEDIRKVLQERRLSR
ncbi:MAG: bifunctional phosphoribosyl-AMP cyclohydrolase/phosphoribosyl-ATP diphosphatase HisIE [Bacteroidota bacterium]